MATVLLFATIKLSEQNQSTITNAQKQLEVARLDRLAAEEVAAKIETLADAEKKRISLAGAITEHDRILAEIARDRDIGIAQSLAKINVPSTIINSGSSGGGSTSDLINLFLMRQSGIIQLDPMVQPLAQPAQPSQ